MKYKTIEASREVRLWISQILIPAAIATASILSIPGMKDAIGEKISAGKEQFKNKH